MCKIYFFQLLSVFINRKNPGLIDDIVFEINFTEDDTKQIVFKNVYWSSFEMNFGVIGEDSILYFKKSYDDPNILRIKEKWKGLINDVDLISYTIQLNSTASCIRVISKSVEIKDIL